MSIQFTSEKALENFICEDSDEFELFLQDEFSIFNLIGIQFVGRQIYLGNFILDVLYYCDVEQDDKIVRYYIVVELKNVMAKAKDLCQLSRYTGIFKDSFEKNEFFKNLDVDILKVKGYLVAPDFDQDLIDLSSSNNLTEEIELVKFVPQVTFENRSYSWKDEFIKDINFDEAVFETKEEE